MLIAFCFYRNVVQFGRTRRLGRRGRRFKSCYSDHFLFGWVPCKHEKPLVDYLSIQTVEAYLVFCQKNGAIVSGKKLSGILYILIFNICLQVSI